MMKPAETLNLTNDNGQIIYIFFESLHMYVYSFTKTVMSYFLITIFKIEILFSVMKKKSGKQ